MVHSIHALTNATVTLVWLASSQWDDAGGAWRGQQHICGHHLHLSCADTGSRLRVGTAWKDVPRKVEVLETDPAPKPRATGRKKNDDKRKSTNRVTPIMPLKSVAT